MEAHGSVLPIVFLLSAVPALGQKVNPEIQAENLASCAIEISEPPTPYGFAKGTLVSLWYAKNAANRGDEIKTVAKESDNMFSLVTGMMRVTKTSTNDFLCAKHSLRPFTGKGSGDNMKTAAEFMMTVYDAHISINTRLIELYKTLDNLGPETMDKISTLQVKRDQRWADLVQPTSLALMLMVDTKRTDEAGHMTRLAITKEQKQSLLKFIADHFPEFKDGTRRNEWTDPAKTAEMYFKVFEGRRCADE
jgi:hypothetical protein